MYILTPARGRRGSSRVCLPLRDFGYCVGVPGWGYLKTQIGAKVLVKLRWYLGRTGGLAPRPHFKSTFFAVFVKFWVILEFCTPLSLAGIFCFLCKIFILTHNFCSFRPESKLNLTYPEGGTWKRKSERRLGYLSKWGDIWGGPRGLAPLPYIKSTFFATFVKFWVFLEFCSPYSQEYFAPFVKFSYYHTIFARFNQGLGWIRRTNPEHFFAGTTYLHRDVSKIPAPILLFWWGRHQLYGVYRTFCTQRGHFQ